MKRLRTKYEKVWRVRWPAGDIEFDSEANAKAGALFIGKLLGVEVEEECFKREVARQSGKE